MICGARAGTERGRDEEKCEKFFLPLSTHHTSALSFAFLLRPELLKRIETKAGVYALWVGIVALEQENTDGLV